MIADKERELLAGPLIFGRKTRAFTLVTGEITTSLEWTPVSVSTPAETKSMLQYLSMRSSLYTLKRPGKSWDISVLAVDIASFSGLLVWKMTFGYLKDNGCGAENQREIKLNLRLGYCLRTRLATHYCSRFFNNI